MTAPKCSDDTFIEYFESYGAARTADLVGVSVRSVHKRRRNIERLIGRPLASPNKSRAQAVPGRKLLPLENGIVLVGSDAHYWPGHITTAHKAFVHFCEKLRPKIVVANGDMCDFASISRHPPISWEHTPTVKEEIDACKERLDEIVAAAKNATFIWTAGNHDLRFESAIAKHLPEMAKVQGVHLSDHFPEWQTCWSAWINNDVVIKHRWRGGIHAVRNNIINAGKSMVTGHLHSLKVTPVTFYDRTLWGVDSGTLAEPYGPQFEYAEDNPRDWRSGFAVLTFMNAEMQPPEIVMVVDDEYVSFRGERIKV